MKIVNLVLIDRSVQIETEFKNSHYILACRSHLFQRTTWKMFGKVKQVFKKSWRYKTETIGSQVILDQHNIGNKREYKWKYENVW